MGTNLVTLKVNNVNKIFVNQNNTQEVLRDINFEVKEGEIVTLLGPSGCGKSTLISLIGGFELPSNGEIFIHNDKVVKPKDNTITLFQNYGLFPWRNALSNVEFGLEEKKLSKQERREKALKYLELVGLEDEKDLFPHQLSGGMKQRIAIARALVVEPEVILLDEPFAALDTFNRYYLQDEILKISKNSKVTFLLVTHDIDEALYLSDRILIMKSNPGRIEKEIVIDLPKPRDRNSVEFQSFRRDIFREYELSRM